ncbi:hypothetical protein B1H39_15640 [Serratia marcescens]|nr:Hypothetical protein SmN45_4299 [Serratia marcescens]OPJ93651.1 hypothetical protein B1H39_15640 [Serratia marcescens]OPJ96247.1 hypothetical protein B1R44_14415 [Serratia marcescens]RFT80013.1 hypothetical protein DX900_15710 [Serratia marcescens]HEJ9080515.1 hypothetical protein [Serratia marcescens]
MAPALKGGRSMLWPPYLFLLAFIFQIVNISAHKIIVRTAAWQENSEKCRRHRRAYRLAGK